jgi:hypothetical protein
VSRSSDIDFNFVDTLSIPGSVRLLERHGARFSRDGLLSYVLDKDETFDWQQVESGALDDLLVRAAAEGVSTSFGVTVFLDDRNTGGDLLYHPGHQTVSFMATINRKLLPGSARFCDMGWYLAKLIPPLEEIGLHDYVASDYE